MNILFNKKNTAHKSLGFSLIEMMVAVSIFVVVAMVAMGSILTIVDANRKAQALKVVMDNLNYALETMTRTIKTGKIKNGDLGSVTVINQDKEEVTYSLSDEQIIRTVVDGAGHTVTEPITAAPPELSISKLSFAPDLRGNSPLPGRQPMLVVTLSGTAKIGNKAISNFNIQTTVTQRLPGS